LTAARDEVFEFDAQLKFPKQAGQDIRVAILSPDRELRSWLRDLCLQAGFGISDAAWDESARILIVDLDPFTQAVKAKLDRFQQQPGRGKILALKGMVSPEDPRQLQGEGVDAVLSKLTPAAQLLETVRRLSQGQEHGE
jgi:hypothetical protein